MQTRYGLPLVLAALLAGIGAVPAQTLDYWGEAGGWDVLIDPSLGNGCLIQAEYDNGVTVRIGFDMVQEMGYVTAFNEAWGDIVEGQSYPVAFDLDGEHYEGEAVGLYLNGVPGADILFDSTDFLWDIAAKQTMTLYNENGEVMAIDLTGTMVGLDAALQCQGENG